MKTFFYIILLYSLIVTDFSNNCFAQNRTIDSLLNLIKTDKEDTNKIKHFNLITNEYFNIGNFIDGVKLSKESISLSEKLNWKIGKGAALNNLGISYTYLGNYPEALNSLYLALKIDEELNNKYDIATVYSNIGNVYNMQNNYEKALNNYLLGINIAKYANSKNLLAALYNNTGLIYVDEKNYDEALKYYYKALKIKEETGNKRTIAYTIANIGELYLKTGNYPESLKNFKNSLKMLEDINDKYGIAQTYLGLGAVYIKLNKNIEAQIYLNKALLFSKELGAMELIKEIYNGMTELDEKTGDFKSAFQHHKLYISYRDSLNNDETKKKTLQTTMQYEYDKKDIAAKAKQEELDAITKEERKKNQIIILAIVAVLIIVLVFSVFIYNRIKITQKQKIKIQTQKIQIEASHKNISDSITYAQKIQDSILPPEREIKKYLPESFIYFQPKDVIGGDFYWFYHRQNFSYIAVVDCTGHGVPGALVSMTINSLLDEVIQDESLTIPGEVLSRLHSSVYKTLQQQKGDNYSQDGCDMSLCVIDHSKKLLHFSGARNHAYLVDGKDIRILKATSKSVGGLSLIGLAEPDRAFKTETIELRDELFLVMSTDGIFDQLNEKDEAFGNKKFNEMISAIYNSSINQGSSIVDSFITLWKKDLHSQDDMLVMGFGLKI